MAVGTSFGTKSNTSTLALGITFSKVTAGKSVEQPLDYSKDRYSESCEVEEEIKAAACNICRSNVILKVTESLGQETVTRLALEVCQQRKGEGCVKSLYLAPTVPLVRQVDEEARKHFSCLKHVLVIGNAEVDSWKKPEWCKILDEHDLIITLPQLLLDTLDAKFLHMSSFETLVINECQHCSGRHPFARIFHDHYRLVQKGQIRVVGLSRCLVKPKVKSESKRQRMIRKLELLMDSEVWKLDDSAV